MENSLEARASHLIKQGFKLTAVIVPPRSPAKK
jgi:hypothetical protein